MTTFTVGSPTIAVVSPCGEQDAITQPELVQGVALRYGAPYIAIPQAGHASYLDNEIFFNQQLLRIGEEVRDECTN